MKKRSYRYDINRPRPRHEHKYTKYKMCLSIMTLENRQNENSWLYVSSNT